MRHNLSRLITLTETSSGKTYPAKRIPGFGSIYTRYYATPTGEILSVSRPIKRLGGKRRVRVLTQRTRFNYAGEPRKFVGLATPTRTSCQDVHRLIASVFCGGRDTLDPDGNLRDEVNHVSGNGMLHNSAANLEWCSRAENNIHAHQITPAVEAERRILADDANQTDEYLLAIGEDWADGTPMCDLYDYYGKTDVKVALRLFGGSVDA